MSQHLKEELAWAIDKWLQGISNIMLFKTVVPVRNFRILKQYYMHCYVALSNIF